MKASKEQFGAFMAVQESGLTNMWDVNRVIELARDINDVKLTRDECLDIMHNYKEYEDEYERKNTGAVI